MLTEKLSKIRGWLARKINIKTTAILTLIISIVPVCAACACAIVSIYILELQSNVIENGGKASESIIAIERNFARIQPGNPLSIVNKAKTDNVKQFTILESIAKEGNVDIDINEVNSLNSIQTLDSKSQSVLNEIFAGAQRSIVKSQNNKKLLESVAYRLTPVNSVVVTIIAIVIYVLTLRLLKELREALARISQTAEKLGTASRTLHSNADGIAAASTQISDSIRMVSSGTTEQAQVATQASRQVELIHDAIVKVSEGARNQYENVTQAASKLSSLTSMVQKIANTSHKVAGVAMDTATSADKGGTAVQATIEGMERIKVVSQESADKIQALGEKSKQIGEIIEVIDDIAEQTNLLALNAAIEAARAGEQGKGFAVVADEVRKLAERSARATGEIAALIKGIQTETLHAVTAMEKGTSEVESGSELAHNAGSSIQEMTAAIQEVSSQIEEVSKAIEDIKVSSSEMDQIMDNIASITDDNASATEEANASVDTIVHYIETIAATSEMSASLSEQVSVATQDQTASVVDITTKAEDLIEVAGDLEAMIVKLKTWC